MNCPICKKSATRLTIAYLNGERTEGCPSCMYDKIPSVYSTEKRIRFHPTGSFNISAAHIRDIKQRRVVPDASILGSGGSKVWTDKGRVRTPNFFFKTKAP